MKKHLEARWHDLQDSLWFVPAIMTSTAIVLALLLVRVDQRLLLDRRANVAWLFGGGAEGARGVLAAIAGTMITVTGVVFSITIVALQLASSQFSPRVLRNFTGDRGNQFVLGAFIGTFTFALLVLRSVRSATEDGQLFVPSVSVTAAIILALACMGLLIYYIHHAARSIQASVVIERAARDTFALIDVLFPEAVGRPSGVSATAESLPTALGATVRAVDSGYVQAIGEDVLFDLAERHALVVRLEPRIGEFVLPGAPIATVWPASVGDDCHDAIRGGVVLGSERTSRADVELGIRQLADIALKALSPGINDPTTATICIDRLAEALVRLACRPRPQEARASEDGKSRLVLQGPPWERLVEVAFAQVRHYGAADATVIEHLVVTLGRMTSLVPADRRGPLVREACLALAAARQQSGVAADAERVEAAGAWIRACESGQRPIAEA